MTKKVKIGNKSVGDGEPSFIVAEIGINHNGDLDIAKKLIDAAALAGCDAVKFQKRTPELCVPPEQRNVMRETPWGIMTYMEYRERIEFSYKQYSEVDAYCRTQKINWYASPWDSPSVDFLEQFNPICYKIASATLTDLELLRRVAETRRPVILSTGMSTMEQIRAATASFDRDRVVLTQSTSAYPCKPEELNLRAITTLREEFGVPVGYSGHEVGLQTTCAAMVLGACLLERHITLDRAMWGSDHAASIEPSGLMRLVRDVRVIEAALGDGKKRVYDSELPGMKKLRRMTNQVATK